MSEGRPQTTIYEGPTNTGTRGKLLFILDDSFAVADLIGKPVKISRRIDDDLKCDHPGSAATSPEPAVLSQTTLRDANGELLVLSSPATPTDQAGKLFSFPQLAPELSARWVSDTTCTPHRLTLELTSTKTGTRVSAEPGQRAELDLGSAKYVLAVESIREPEGPGLCGAASWILYRKGFFTRAK